MNKIGLAGFVTVFVTASLGLAACAESDFAELATPHSLHDTVPDGVVGVVSGGEFVADEGTVQFFDYFLTAEGELAEPELNGLVAGHLERRLDERDASQVMTAFTAYVAYRREAAERMQQGDAESARAQLVELAGKSATQLPGVAADVDHIERAAAVREVLADYRQQQTTRAEARERMARIADAFADSDSEDRSASLTAADLARDTRALTAASGSSAEIHALRTARVGLAAAERLAALDKKRAEWRQRVSVYQTERAEILSKNLDEAARERALAALADRHFDSREQLRLRAIRSSAR